MNKQADRRNNNDVFPPQQSKRNESYTRFRGILHFTMGVLYILMGSAIIYLRNKKILFDIDMTLAYLIGGLMIAYGIFRVYRGWQRLTGKAEGW